MDTTELLHCVKAAVLEIEPSAEIILYGSRARSDAKPDSDWDFLILMDSVLSREREKVLRHCLYHLERQYEEIFSVILRNRNEWLLPLHRATPFSQNVRHDGIHL